MEEELLSNIKTFFNSAEMVYKSNDYTSATILYFKAIFVALDLIIFRKNKITPKDHTERFKILKKDFFYEYNLLDKYYHIYRNTYSTKIDKEICEEIRKYAAKIIKENLRI